jgi:Family of unknown function (DUF5343)
MADELADTKVSYPYMTASQWHGIRDRLRKSVPKVVDVDWVMAALGTSEKGARNVLPQLRAVGLIGSDGKPVEDLVHDVRDDSSYAAACRLILESLYPPALLDTWPDPGEDPDKVAAWFMRNAGTGAATGRMQARLYLLLLSGELPSRDESAKKAAVKRATPATPRKQSAKNASTASVNQTDRQSAPDPTKENPPRGSNSFGPALHIDMQIHISADASDMQIDTIFKSMAKHLYGRE